MHQVFIYSKFRSDIMKKKKKILLGVLTLVSFIGIGAYLSLNNNSIKEDTKSKNDLIAIYTETEDGEYTLSNSTSFPTDGYILNTERSSCQNGGVLSQDPKTKAISMSTSVQDSCTLYFEKEIPSADKTITSLGITVNLGEPTFANAATTDEGVYSMADDYGTSYYYRGAVTNNYVKFANKWWRIIRINGDGSIRMIYDGTQGYANGTSNTARSALQRITFNTSVYDAKYAGYMYGPEGTTSSTSYEQATTNMVSSNIKTQLDNWYKTNIVDAGFSSYVSDEIFCNDRSIPGQSVTGWSVDTGLGYGRNTTSYGAWSRFVDSTGSNSSKPNPKFTCTNKNDAFTVSDTTKGNGALTYPIGLITVDEIVTAGSGINTPNSNYYLYKGREYWSLSPCYFSDGHISIFNVGGNGWLYRYSVNNDAVDAVPVINLSPKTAANLKGSGTMSNPYTVE